MSSVQKTIDRLTKRMRGIDIPFSIEFPIGEKHAVGRGESEFQLSFRNSRSLGALRTLDKIEFVDAYFHGSIDLEGNMLKLFALRAELGGPHPLIKVWHSVRRLLSRYIFSNQRAIASSYDPKLLMSFLDPLIPAYTHGVHGHDEEPLATALVRKFEFAIVKCGLEAGKTVLEIGPRWGAFTAYALQAGVRSWRFITTWSNHLTYRQWARNFEANKSYVQRTFGDVEYRKFRFYLWGAAYAFLARKLDCYRLILKDDVIEHIGEAVLVPKGLRRSI
jgi:Mycolic acid cyclopropane synthetase